MFRFSSKISRSKCSFQILLLCVSSAINFIIISSPRHCARVSLHDDPRGLAISSITGSWFPITMIRMPSSCIAYLVVSRCFPCAAVWPVGDHFLFALLLSSCNCINDHHLHLQQYWIVAARFRLVLVHPHYFTSSVSSISGEHPPIHHLGGARCGTSNPSRGWKKYALLDKTRIVSQMITSGMD